MTTPAPATVTEPATAPTPATSFGQEQLTREQRPAPEKEQLTLHAKLSSQKSVGPGLFNLYLDNGQIWRHEDQVQGSYLKDGDAITIEKGAMGSYKLTRDAGKSRNWISRHARALKGGGAPSTPPPSDCSWSGQRQNFAFKPM